MVDNYNLLENTRVSDAAFATMRRLAAGERGDTPVVGGESGVAGLAGLLALCNDGETARRLHLDEHARVLAFGTEGDTDAELYTRVVGESGDQVRGRQLRFLSRNGGEGERGVL